MNYFDGLQFIGSGIYENHLHCSDKTFTYYGIQYNHQGMFRVVFDRRREYLVEGPHVLITYPGPNFTYGAADDIGRTHCWTCFTGERVERFLAGGLLPIDPEQPLIKITRPKPFMDTVRELNQTINLGPEHHNRAVCLLENLLLQLHQQDAPRQALPHHHQLKLRKLIDAVKAAPQLEWNFEREAADMFVSVTHFRRIFKQFTTLSPQQFLINCRLQLAVKKLLTTDDPVGMVAGACGFDDEFYFSRMFKKHFHLPPQTYRREFIA